MTGDTHDERRKALHTDRLRLRALAPGDAERIADLVGDLGVSGNLARVPHPYHVADARHWLASHPEDPVPERTTFGIEADGELVGVVGFHADGSDTVIGYWLGRDHWGRGYATEAADAALRWYFAATDAPAICSGAFAHNTASLAIQRKLGFVETGRSSEHCLARDAWIEHVDTVLTRSAFEQARQELRRDKKVGMR